MTAEQVGQMTNEEFNYWIAYHKIENEKHPVNNPQGAHRTSGPQSWTVQKTPATFQNDVTAAMKKRGINLQSGYKF